MTNVEAKFVVVLLGSLSNPGIAKLRWCGRLKKTVVIPASFVLQLGVKGDTYSLKRSWTNLEWLCIRIREIRPAYRYLANFV